MKNKNKKYTDFIKYQDKYAMNKNSDEQRNTKDSIDKSIN